jgi:hypothetical protein
MLKMGNLKKLAAAQKTQLQQSSSASESMQRAMVRLNDENEQLLASVEKVGFFYIFFHLFMNFFLFRIEEVCAICKRTSRT